MKKYIVTLTAVLALLLCFATGAGAASGAIKVWVDGNEVGFDTAPTIENGRTLVPLRAIFEALGAEVDWDGEAYRVTASRGDITVSLTVGESVIFVNGEGKTLDTAAKLIDNRTYVPVRAISEAFGALTEWNGDARAVIVTDDALVKRFKADIRQADEIYGNGQVKINMSYAGETLAEGTLDAAVGFDRRNNLLTTSMMYDLGFMDYTYLYSASADKTVEIVNGEKTESAGVTAAELSAQFPPAVLQAVEHTGGFGAYKLYKELDAATGEMIGVLQINTSTARLERYSVNLSLVEDEDGMLSYDSTLPLDIRYGSGETKALFDTIK